MNPDNLTKEEAIALFAPKHHVHSGSDTPRVDYSFLFNRPDILFSKGDGSDGELAQSSGTQTFNIASNKLLVKNFRSIEITGTGVVNFSNPATNGSVVIFKCQNNCRLVAGAAMIDASALGGPGGATDAAGTAGTPFIGAIGGGATLRTGGTRLTPLFDQTFIFYANVLPVLVGAGGGGGQSGSDGAGTSAGGAGGRGGGCFILIVGGSIEFSTANGISVKGGVGLVGSTGATSGGGGGGGGGGGSGIVLYKTAIDVSGTINSAGGTGGTGANGGGGAGTGGDGGGGGGSYYIGGDGQDGTAGGGGGTGGAGGAGGNGGNGSNGSAPTNNAGAGGGGGAGGIGIVIQNDFFT